LLKSGIRFAYNKILMPYINSKRVNPDHHKLVIPESGVLTVARQANLAPWNQLVARETGRRQRPPL